MLHTTPSFRSAFRASSRSLIDPARRQALAMLAGVGLAMTLAGPARAQSAPEDLIRKVSTEVLDAVKADKAIQAGDVSRVLALVDEKVMPHVNFQRMTASAVGRFWRQATPDQQKRLQEEFKTLLVRTYSGALAQVKDQTVELRPVRANPGDTEVMVRTQIKGRGDPIQLDYRLEKAGDAWKIYDVNVLGVWLVQSYQTQFAQEINAGGIDALIAKLAERNKAARS
jgi:phospholipid transport system substrate-binding protein